MTSNAQAPDPAISDPAISTTAHDAPLMSDYADEMIDDPLSPEDLRILAQAYEGLIYETDDPRGQPASHYDWHYDPAFPIERLDGPEDWSSWFDAELEMMKADGVSRDWDLLAEEEIQEPIIVVDATATAGIWDGWHRTGGSLRAGRTDIPAIVGTPRDKPAVG